jgi:soluble lytic murein transglycosylase
MSLKISLSQWAGAVLMAGTLTACAQPPRTPPKTANQQVSPSTQANPAPDSRPGTVNASADAGNSVQGDAAVLDMAAAFKRGDSKTLTRLLPKVRGHILEPWGAYWELRARLEQASDDEVRGFLARYPNSYQEDRLRNDWLLLLGSRRDWTTLAQEHAQYRMRDDREVQCYVAAIEFLQQGSSAKTNLVEDTYNLWLMQREGDEGCAFAADRMHEAGKLSDLQIWRKARIATDLGRQKSARQALDIVLPKESGRFGDLWKKPAKWLSAYASNPRRATSELAVLALLRLASEHPDEVSHLMRTLWQPVLSAEQRDWVWGALGRQAAMRLDDEALAEYRKVSHLSNLSDDMLAWYARAALRSAPEPNWRWVESAIQAMSVNAQRDNAWVYWLARAEINLHPPKSPAHQAALQALEKIAGFRGFYEQLAAEQLGRKVVAPPRPDPLTEAELSPARQNPGLQRALYAISLGLRSEGVREWNYTAHLVNAQGQAGRMNDRELLATAALACEQQIWDRCINTSERTRELFDTEASFPMPFRDAVIQRSKEISLDPAYVYGLIRQESRFVMDAHSNVGASGLMQVMPATAKWTARKIGLSNFKPEHLTRHDINIAIGTGYLKLVLDSFSGSMPLAAAAYNAGPSRARKWSQGRNLEAAIWAENVPFNETRDYVKKVLSNTTLYAAIITGQPQSLKERLGMVGPQEANAGEPADMP